MLLKFINNAIIYRQYFVTIFVVNYIKTHSGGNEARKL